MAEADELLELLQTGTALDIIPDEISFDLQSSALAGGVFHWKTGQLDLDFTDGTSHSYAAVSVSVVAGLIGAPSAGTYFFKYIRPLDPGL
jgi:hypothetical protein